MAEWTKEDEELFKKYAKEFERNILFGGGYTDPEEIKKESDRIVKHHNIEDAHATLGNTFGRGGGSKWAKARGLEGLVDTATMLGSTASASTGKDYAKKHLPQNNAKMFEEAGEDLLVGEDVEKKVAGGEGQSYGRTTKSSLKTHDLSAQEFKKLRDEFRKNSSEGFLSNNFDFDPDDTETKKLIDKIKNEKITPSKDSKYYNPYMKLSNEERREAATKNRYNYLGDQVDDSRANLDKMHRTPEEIVYTQRAPSNMTEPGTVINEGMPIKQRVEARMNHNEAEAERAYEANKMIEKLAYFMDTYGDTPIGKALRKTAESTFDWKLSEPETTGHLPQRYKNIINVEARSPRKAERAKKLRDGLTKRGQDYAEEALKPAAEKLRNQFDSIYPTKTIINFAERIAGREFPNRETAVAFLASAVANMLYSEDLGKQHTSKLYEDEGLIPSEGTYGARYNAERLEGKDRAKMLKAGDLLINDWLSKFSEKNVDEDDIEVLEEIKNLMNGYNKSKGQSIRASDDVIADILSNPVYMKMFNKYNDPMLHR